MTDKAIKAAVDKAIELGLGVVDEIRLYTIMRAAIAAYEQAMWRPIDDSGNVLGFEYLVYIPPSSYSRERITMSWDVEYTNGATQYRPLPPQPKE